MNRWETCAFGMRRKKQVCKVLNTRVEENGVLISIKKYCESGVCKFYKPHNPEMSAECVRDMSLYPHWKEGRRPGETWREFKERMAG